MNLTLTEIKRLRTGIHPQHWKLGNFSIEDSDFIACSPEMVDILLNLLDEANEIILDALTWPAELKESESWKLHPSRARAFAWTEKVGEGE